MPIEKLIELHRDTCNALSSCNEDAFDGTMLKYIGESAQAPVHARLQDYPPGPSRPYTLVFAVKNLTHVLTFRNFPSECGGTSDIRVWEAAAATSSPDANRRVSDDLYKSINQHEDLENYLIDELEGIPDLCNEDVACIVIMSCGIVRNRVSENDRTKAKVFRLDLGTTHDADKPLGFDDIRTMASNYLRERGCTTMLTSAKRLLLVGDEPRSYDPSPGRAARKPRTGRRRRGGRRKWSDQWDQWKPPAKHGRRESSPGREAKRPRTESEVT